MKQNPCKSKESQTKSTLKSKETHTNPKKKKKPTERQSLYDSDLAEREK